MLLLFNIILQYPVLLTKDAVQLTQIEYLQLLFLNNKFMCKYLEKY